MQDLVKWHGPYDQRPSKVCQRQLCQFCTQLETSNRDPSKHTEAKLKVATHYKGCVPYFDQQTTRVLACTAMDGSEQAGCMRRQGMPSLHPEQ
jgi:hypothetical protein